MFKFETKHLQFKFSFGKKATVKKIIKETNQ